ncbi:MAG: hypothetical protein HC811_08965, partial [Flammeovirgaceae bacterium]|nr:hypothetical protein [Flammeovirgaceae bacterium]
MASCSIAEKIARQDLNEPGDPDIVASFSSGANWHYYNPTNPNAPVPSGKYDLVTVVLHEIGHGLGLLRSYTVSGNDGQVSEFFGLPMVYEAFLESNSGLNLIQKFQSPSPNLKAELISENLHFDSPQVLAANNGQRARIYAPTTFAAGSSIAHLNEDTYPSGSPNALMTPSISPQEVNHDPGQIAMAVYNEIGWKGILIDHTALANTEDTSNPFEVICSINSDEPYNSSSVTLHYRTGTSSFTTLPMNSTGNMDEFSATIPALGAAVYSYYISVTDSDSKIFTRPGKLYIQGVDLVEQVHFIFEAGPDTKAPFISHEPNPFILSTD